MDKNQTIYIADSDNDRIVAWKKDATFGQIVAGGNGRGDRNNQLNDPTDVIIDYQNDTLIIADMGNRRVVRWPRENGESGETIISNIRCCSLTMNINDDLYATDYKSDEVRRWKIGETEGTINSINHIMRSSTRMNLFMCLIVEIIVL